MERPILFSAPMVRAILDGSKTQTRRVVKPQPTIDGDSIHWTSPKYDNGMGCNYLHTRIEPGLRLMLNGCPHGKPGDQLWVRESFWGCDLPGYGDMPCVVYDDEWFGKEYRPLEARPWGRKFGRIPSIHMPRDCSRIQLEITTTRVERLNDCSEADSIAEGIENNPQLDPAGTCHWRVYGKEGAGTNMPESSYKSLWESINGPGSWDVNPWVWVVEFRVLQTKPDVLQPAN